MHLLFKSSGIAFTIIFNNFFPNNTFIDTTLKVKRWLIRISLYDGCLFHFCGLVHDDHIEVAKLEEHSQFLLISGIFIRKKKEEETLAVGERDHS